MHDPLGRDEAMRRGPRQKDGAKAARADRDVATSSLQEKVAALSASIEHTTSEIAQREDQIELLQRKLLERERQLVDTEAALAQRDAAAIAAERRLEEQTRSAEGRAAQEAAEAVRRSLAIAELRSALAEHSRHAQELNAEFARSLAERDQVLAERDGELMAARAEFARSLAERDKVLAERDGELMAARAELATVRESTVQAERMLRVAAEGRTLADVRAELADEIASHDADIAERDARLSGAYKELETTTTEYLLITSSASWSLMRLMWRVRLWLAPHDSRREGLIRLLRRVFVVWRHSGPVAVITKVKEFAVPTTPTQVWVPSAHGLIEGADLPAAYDVIVLPVIDWDYRFQRPQQLSVEMNKAGHRVYYAKTSFRGQRERPLRTIASGLTEYELPGPRTLTVYRHFAEPSLVETWVEHFAGLRRDQGIETAVCVVNLPFWSDLAFRLREQFGWKVVYDCMDSHAGFTTNDALMLRAEKDLVRRCDLLVVTAKRLEEELAPLAPRHLRVPNAGDYEHFSVVPASPAPEVAELEHPILGYYGAISDWFDTQLVAEIARSRPRWSIVLVGRTFGADLSSLKGLSNVHLVDEQRYDDLPAYLHGFDACMIPFKLTPLTESTDPVKLYEFLSAGKPVISVPLPELNKSETRDVVSFASTADEFVRAVERAIAENSPTAIASRQTFARQNTWSARFAELDRGVRELFPRVTVVVLTYNNLELTKLCLDSIIHETMWPNLELVLVDNASSDGTPEFLREFASTHECKLILNSANEGFAAGNNRGIRESTGEYVVLLNNDTVVSRGWLTRMVRYFERDPSIGLLGPVTNGVGNEAKIDVPYTELSGMPGFARQRRLEYEGQTFEIGMLALFCAMMRRSLLDDIGLLDERFGVGMFEDDDLAVRVRRRGLRIVCAEDVFIHHYHGAAFKAMPRDEYREIFDANRKMFEEKWGRAWVPHQYRAAEPKGQDG